MKRNRTVLSVLATAFLVPAGTSHVKATDPNMGEMQVDRQAIETRFDEQPYSPWAETDHQERAYTSPI